jgi:hypothetical protein
MREQKLQKIWETKLHNLGTKVKKISKILEQKSRNKNSKNLGTKV